MENFKGGTEVTNTEKQRVRLEAQLEVAELLLKKVTACNSVDAARKIIADHWKKITALLKRLKEEEGK